MTPPTLPNALPDDLASIADLSSGRLAYLGRRYVQRLADERRVTTWVIGSKRLISPSEVEALIIARPPLAG